MIGAVASLEVPMHPVLLQRVHVSSCLANISYVSSSENSYSLRIEFVRLLWHCLPLCNCHPQHSWDRTPLLSNANAYSLDP